MPSPDPRPARHHEAPPPRLGDGGRAGGAGHAGLPGGDAFLLRRDGREPDRRPGTPRHHGRRASRRSSSGAPVPRLVGGGPRLRVLAQPADGATPAGAVAGGRRSPEEGGARDLALFRDAGRPRGPLAPSRQPSGRPGTAGGPPDLADQHRAGPPLHARGARSGPAAGGCDGRKARGDADHGRRAGAPRGAPPELVRHAKPRAAPAALRVHGGQRQPRGGAARPRGRVPATGRVATGTWHRACPTLPVARRPWRTG